MQEESFLFKDCINEKVIKELGRNLKKNYPPFQKHKFEKIIISGLSDLSLTQRLELVTDQLFEYLPKDYKSAVKIMLASLPPELPNSSDQTEGSGAETNATLNGFIMVSLTSYVSRYGLDHFDLSTKALYEMTKRFSSEGSMRYFILHEQKKSMDLLLKWTKDKNMHVRRLASECCRPRLPWTIQLKPFVKNPKPIIKILNQLYLDPEIYVRRSVANNLNDIAKDHPDVVVSILKKWNANSSSKEINWLTNHALRTLLKQGNPDALALIGYSPQVKIKVSEIQLAKKKIVMGERLKFSLELQSQSANTEKIMLDYIIYHLKANGELTPKVFKWKKIILAAGEKIKLEKQHLFKEITTRKYYSGRHEIQIQINGKRFNKDSFKLIK